jgi:hypothetical protein
MSGPPKRLAALTRVAAIQHELDCPAGPALLDPMGVTMLGGGDRTAVLGAEVDAGCSASDEEESAVSFPFRPDHENTTLRDDIFTPRDSCLR